MKKRLVLFFLLINLVFSVEKSGLSKFDKLDALKGETLYFYNSKTRQKTKTKINNSDIERKIFKSGSKYIVVDYYVLNGQPSLIFETKDNPKEYLILIVEGYRISYYENGEIESINKYKFNDAVVEHSFK